MARLTMDRGRIAPMDMRIARPPPKEADPHYKSPEHRAWRAAVLKRDGYRCQGEGPHSGPLHAHHVVEVRDGGAPLDVANGQTRCQACHNRVTAMNAKRRTAMAVRRWGFSIPHGVERSGVPVQLVYGPPGAGKSTFVRERAQSIDLVIDLDECLLSVGGQRWDTRPSMVKSALRVRDGLIRSLAGRSSGCCWLIVAAPTCEERSAWVEALGAVTAHKIVAPMDECIRRIRSDPARSHAQADLIARVREWFAIER